MNRIQKKISKEVNKRIDEAIDNYYKSAKMKKLDNGTLIELDIELLRQLLVDITRHRVKRQVVKDFKKQGLL